MLDSSVNASVLNSALSKEPLIIKNGYCSNTKYSNYLLIYYDMMNNIPTMHYSAYVNGNNALIRPVSQDLSNSAMCYVVLLGYNEDKVLYYVDYTGNTGASIAYYENYKNEYTLSEFQKFIDVIDFVDKIQGFVRFECEIKKKKLSTIYFKKYVRLTLVRYEDLESVWRDEFMKILKFDDKNSKRVRTKEEVRNRLNEKYKNAKALRLYQFFITILNDGYNTVKNEVSSSTFYRNIDDLKSAGIDFSQSNFDDIATVDFDNMVDFDPFTWKEVV